MNLGETYKLYWEELLEQKFGFADMADLAWQEAEGLIGYQKEKSLYIYFDRKMVAFYSHADSKREAELGYDFYRSKDNVEKVVAIKRQAFESSQKFLDELAQKDIAALSEDDLRQEILSLMDAYFRGLSAHYLTQPQFFEKFEALGDDDHAENLKALADARFHYSKPAWVKPLQAYDPLYAEYAKRVGFSADQVKSLTRKELESKVPVSAAELEKRIEKYAIVSDFHELTSFFGNAADAYIDAYHRYIDSYEKQTGQGIAKGVIGNKGIVRGEAFVIKNEQFDPANMPTGMVKGMILVVQNAWPDLQGYYELASGIVTNEGGITSHGVVVAREMRIPCVVGTRIATKIFKTGDFLELDANTGTVRLIT